MPHVLIVSAVEFRDPVAIFVLMPLLPAGIGALPQERLIDRARHQRNRFADAVTGSMLDSDAAPRQYPTQLAGRTVGDLNRYNVTGRFHGFAPLHLDASGQFQFPDRRQQLIRPLRWNGDLHDSRHALPAGSTLSQEHQRTR